MKRFLICAAVALLAIGGLLSSAGQAEASPPYRYGGWGRSGYWGGNYWGGYYRGGYPYRYGYNPGYYRPYRSYYYAPNPYIYSPYYYNSPGFYFGYQSPGFGFYYGR